MAPRTNRFPFGLDRAAFEGRGGCCARDILPLSALRQPSDSYDLCRCCSEQKPSVSDFLLGMRYRISNASNSLTQ